MNPLDILSVHKHITNRTLELMGIRTAAMEGAEFDSIAHLAPSFKEFGRRTMDEGLRGALAWRDGPYSTGPLARSRRRHPASPLIVTTSPATVRLLHASDIHVGDIHVDKGDPVKPLIDAALAERVDAVLLVGDIFDHNRIPTEVGQALVDELARLDVPVVVLPGNHDCLVPDAIWSRVTLPPNVHLMTDADGEHVELDELDVSIWGRPHPSYGDLRPLAGLPARSGRTWDLALAHGHMVLRPRGPPPGLPDHARGDRRLRAGLRRPRPLGRGPGHERRRRHRPLLGLGEPLRRVRAGDADRRPRRADGGRRAAGARRRLRLVDSAG